MLETSLLAAGTQPIPSFQLPPTNAHFASLRLLGPLTARTQPPPTTMQEAVEAERRNWTTRTTGTKAERKFEEWFERYRVGADRHGMLYRPTMNTIGITATTVTVAANALVMLLSHMHRHKADRRSAWPDFVLPKDVLYCSVPDSFQAFLLPERNYIL